MPAGEPGAEPTGTGTVEPDAMTTEDATEGAVVGKGAALVLYTMLVAPDADDTPVDSGIDVDGEEEEEEDAAVERMTALVVGMRM